MKLLELFSGTGSVGKPWREAGHEVISVDVDGRFGADIVEDILQLSYCKLPVPDVIWACGYGLVAAVEPAEWECRWVVVHDGIL